MVLIHDFAENVDFYRFSYYKVSPISDFFE